MPQTENKCFSRKVYVTKSLPDLIEKIRNALFAILSSDPTSSKTSTEIPSIQQGTPSVIQHPTAPAVSLLQQDTDEVQDDGEQDNEFPESNDDNETELTGNSNR